MTSSCPSSKDSAKSFPEVVDACMAKITFTDNDLLLGDTPHNRPSLMIGFAREQKVNRILIDGGSRVNILPIHIMKELGIAMEDLFASCLMIQGFNQGGQRVIGVVKVDLTIGELQSNAWLHVIDARTSYNILLGRPWVHEKKVIPSTYHQCLKYHEDGVEKKIMADDNPFIEAKAHFANAKFYLKKCAAKVDEVAIIDNAEFMNKIAKIVAWKEKVAVKEDQRSFDVSKFPNTNGASSSTKVTSVLHYVPKAKKDEGNMLGGLTLPIKQIDTIKSSTKLLGRFVASSSPHNEALSMKRTDEGFDPNAYKRLAKDGYNPSEPSKLGKILMEPVARQKREGLGYKQPPPVRISIRRVSNNYITAEEEPLASNKRPFVFDRLGKLTARVSVFERMRRQTDLMVSYGEVLKENSHIVVYTKERDEDEQSVGSSYHVTCNHISINDGEPQEDEDAKDALPEFEEGVKTTVNALKEVNLGTDEDPRPTCVNSLLAVDEESAYVELLKEYKDVFSWSYKEMPGLDPKVAVHHLTLKNVLASLVPGKPLILHVSAQERSVGALLAQENSEGKENALYYLSRIMTPNELKYSPMEKLCLALVFSIQKMKHYFQAHIVRLISKANPIKFVMSKPILSDRLVRWYLQFQQFEVVYVPQIAVKGQALADFLADRPIPNDWELTDELPDEDAMVIEIQQP
ncbi:uncharacterized protein LOC132630681 [Lycium barbarum]|uniref:uncharacterized protein LOC132630681 n=1 Tax=Lycium barbarum TaxID=112863 RepID=UPI00293E5E60|nr:uncharacterized protein LOC132630681 [Lycium barbarum]